MKYILKRDFTTGNLIDTFITSHRPHFIL